jgi:ABC-type uncharacterized transport system involved in gliding motility auxiliary subunit
MEKKQQIILTALSLACIFLGLLVSGRLWFRLDLTAHKAYTISQVSRDLYKDIPDQVRITYYLSDKLYSAHPLPGEIDDLLQEYAAYSRGKIRYTRRDPVKAGLEEAVQDMGVIPQQIQTVEKDEASIATVYTGITIEYLDKLEVLPVVFSLDSLEYDLTSRIRSLSKGTEREVGIIVGDSFRQWEQDYRILSQSLLRSGFRERLINPGDEIPDTLPCLFVLGGAEDLDRWALYRIDRFIQMGGKVLFLLDSVFVDFQQSWRARVMEDKGLQAMVSLYGATEKPEIVLDRACITVPFNMQTPRGLQLRLVRYPFFIQVQPQAGNRDHPITSRFGGLDIYWPAPVELTPPEGITGTELFTSSPEAWLETKDFQVDPQMLSFFEREVSSTGGVKTLAVDLSGTFPSWFEGIPKPERAGLEESLPDMPLEPRPSRIIVVGNTYLAGSLMQTTGSEGRNLDFLLQSADWLGNVEDIITIRNRQGEPGRLDKIIDPEKRAAAMAFSRVLNVVFIPMLLLFVGVLVALKRRSSIHA